MEKYVRDLQTEYGFQHVWTGHLVKEDLYHRSGHYDNYKDSMFPPMVDENIIFRLKPMNCPSHMTLYHEMGRHSYRELPLRGVGGKYVQDDEKWVKAEAALRAAMDASGLDYFEATGEAAFYGPKADFLARDVLGREGQVSTNQGGFIPPPRLGP